MGHPAADDPGLGDLDASAAERVVAVVLAAGAGSRYVDDHHKLRADVRGTAVVTRAVAAAVAAGLEVVVVVGAADVADLLPPGVEVVRNPRWDEGQATSLAVGIEAARGRGATAVVVGLGDQPFVPAEAWSAVAASPAPLAVATFDGERRPPVRIHRSLWDALPTEGDDGARVLMRRSPELVSEVPCSGEPADIDTVEDLRRWN
ncbi:MAG TPA: NTP transferase domain-containing protein [Acidimicrobiales bacterium]|nr:NTP transferase domain-containing protein [Acidimicrobiales bacterium]